MKFTKKAVVIEALKKQKAKIDDPNEHHNDWVWVAQTAELVKKYIGEKSVLYYTISQFKFSVLDDGTLSGQQLRYAFEEKERIAKRFIDSCIEYIKTNGLHKETTVNFLYRIKVEWLILFATVLIPSLFFFGRWWESYFNDVKKYENKIEQLNKTLDSLQTLVVPTSPDRNTNGDAKEKAKPIGNSK